MSNKRYAKRKARQAYRQMDGVMVKLLELAETFEVDHADLAANLQAISKSILMTQNTFVQWYVKAWGREPGDWYAEVK